jgi:valyl-tRNA synthetase
MGNGIDIKAIEEKWRKYWEKEKIYQFDKKSEKKIYSIDTPPPTVSGEMHIGHAFSYAQEDFIARYMRMSGRNVFYPFGTDDNGLPTEKLIEKIKNVRSKDMSRKEFIDLCLKTLKEIRPEFVNDWKKLGISCDYDIFYSTIDKNSQRLSQKSFIELYKKGLIYRDDFPTIFCPDCQTPIAQAEMEDKLMNTHFTTVKFKSGRKDLPIATTRPELLGACVAVFVNPKDKRYKGLIGKKARVPLFDHEVLIIADNTADMEKGTGVLMVCCYGDKYDVDAVKRYKLEPKVIFGNDGKVKDGKYKGLKVREARKKILEDLSQQDLIIEQKEIEHAVNVHDKCGTEIEFLPVEQWFVKILHKKSELIRQGKKINWKPEYMFKRYENWIKGLQWDWSISRERHFGIPIPVWICRECNWVTLADEKELPVDPSQTKKKCGKCGKKAEGESKVLDTWATSSLTPQITSSLIGNIVKIPYNLRPQAHDIIRTWAFYTIIKSLYHENLTPWNDVAVSGFVTMKGQKMSKSKGNVVAPQQIMNEFGSDALRYWAASSKLGEDLDYMEKDVATGKKFITKIFNATNFVFMNLKHQKTKPNKMHESDRLFLSQLNNLIKSSTEAFDEYNYSKAKKEVDGFFWRVFADNYLEIVKNRVYNGTKEEKASAFYTLYESLKAITKMIAPFTPHICEEIYQTCFKKHEKEKSIHLCEWPKPIGIKEHRHDEKEWSKYAEIIGKVRQAKSEKKVSMKAEIYLTLSKDDYKTLEKVLDDLKAVSCAREIKQGKFDVDFV